VFKGEVTGDRKKEERKKKLVYWKAWW